ncbi:phosphatidate cytidylyltransferase [Luteibacter sp. CQ10]|uniref:phosphatidate cytidylyltransferase n=1 Tax=Luteibacter sp. CQ10 TaxID=2805821 RepID=UPI0034A11C6F
MSDIPKLAWVMAGIFGLLLIASLVAWALSCRAGPQGPSLILRNLNQRIRAWWVMVGVMCACMALGSGATLVLYSLLSAFALREFVTLTPTRRGDYWPLVACFYVALPLQYILIGMQWYGMFAIMLPVYGFLLLPVLAALAGDTEHFLERCAKIQWGLMLTVYCLSHVPALLMLQGPTLGEHGFVLLLYLLLVVQLSDVLQYVCGKLWGKHLLAPRVSPSKTVEGLVGGGLGATLVGAALYAMTPFSFGRALAISALIVACGFFGGLALSAVKRSLGAKDWGTMIEGHGGALDRLDSVVFAAPIFFHVVRWLYG